MHHLISWNFFGGRKLPRGILVLVPTFEKEKSAYASTWGHTEGVDPIIDSRAPMKNAIIDKWIAEIAAVHGLYAGDFPEPFVPEKVLQKASRKAKAAKAAAAAKAKEEATTGMKTGRLVACMVEGKNMFPSRFKIYTHKI